MPAFVCWTARRVRPPAACGPALGCVGAVARRPAGLECASPPAGLFDEHPNVLSARAPPLVLPASALHGRDTCANTTTLGQYNSTHPSFYGGGTRTHVFRGGGLRYCSSMACNRSDAPAKFGRKSLLRVAAARLSAVTHGITESADDVLRPRDFSDVATAADERGAPRDARPATYAAVGAAGVLGALAAKSAASDLVASWSASSEALAFAQTEVDLTAIPEGTSAVVKWRGKPVFIRHRTPAEIAASCAVPLCELRDPQADAERAQRPEWVVMLGICTHLGCVPVGDSGDYGGWYCPCHGSHYDVAGRIRKGPAPTNMEVPTYRFVSDDVLVIG